LPGNWVVLPLILLFKEIHIIVHAILLHKAYKLVADKTMQETGTRRIWVRICEGIDFIQKLI